MQEIAALEVNRHSHAIVDAFHGFAQTEKCDKFARKHVHGLSRNYISIHGRSSEADLIKTFKSWLSFKFCVAIYANNACKERELLKIEINDLTLAPWAERKDRASHKIANRFKKLAIPIVGYRCPPVAHSYFVSPPISSNPTTNIAKSEHGYHCALYDCLELYYEFILL